MLAKLLPTLAVSALIVAGCATPQVQQAGVAEPTDGAASTCTVTPPDLPRGVAATVQMQVANDGGWCAVRIADKAGSPFGYPLMRERAQHGRVAVNKVLSISRIEYTPNAGFTGNDAFAVALIPQDKSEEVMVRVNVVVAAGPGSVAPPPAPASRPATAPSTTTRRSSSSRSSSSTRR